MPDLHLRAALREQSGHLIASCEVIRYKYLQRSLATWTFLHARGSQAFRGVFTFCKKNPLLDARSRKTTEIAFYGKATVLPPSRSCCLSSPLLDLWFWLKWNVTKQRLFKVWRSSPVEEQWLQRCNKAWNEKGWGGIKQKKNNPSFMAKHLQPLKSRVWNFLAEEIQHSTNHRVGRRGTGPDE